MKILYSFNKRGAEARFWSEEIAAASNESVQFLPFNHDPYLDVSSYLRAQQLDNLYFFRHAGVERLYADVEAIISSQSIDVLMVDTCPPYHPEWLRKLPCFKVLRTTDGPMAAYDRDFAYVHAYDLVLYHSPAYSRDLGMKAKLTYVGAKRSAFLPLGVFNAAFSPTKSEDVVFGNERDVDIVFVGALHVGKMPLLAQIKRAFGRRFRMRGLASIKKNIYFNAKYGMPGWIRPISQDEYVPLYERAKIGINVHNRGKYTVGSYRLFELPANGVMQISDGGEYLRDFFVEDEEIVEYRDNDGDELIEKIKFYLEHDDERERIAKGGYRRTLREYRIGPLLQRAAETIRNAA